MNNITTYLRIGKKCFKGSSKKPCSSAKLGYTEADYVRCEDIYRNIDRNKRRLTRKLKEKDYETKLA